MLVILFTNELLEEAKAPPGSSAPEEVMVQWYCTITPEAERCGLSDKQLARYAKKELRKAEEKARAMFIHAVEKEKARWWRY